ncbi:MAG: HugZ family pyridoxamine 5'-phosphate oxidase [Hyphomicrobium sp.]
MTSESKQNSDRPSRQPTPADKSARDLVRTALKGALATLDRTSGHPYASLVTVATEPDGTPLVLISRLALHTQNILADGRASLLVDASGNDGDPLAGGRVTLIGRAEQTEAPAARRRFLERHPAAGGYADFPDFSFYRLAVERGHFIGGFGRIVPLDRAQLVLDLSDASRLVEGETEIVAHMNADHSDAVALYAKRLGGAPAATTADLPWRMTGIDPEGLDVVSSGHTRRISFATRVTTPALARQELTRLAQAARAGGTVSDAEGNAGH